MANLPESSNFTTGIFRLETNTPVLGGVPTFSGATPNGGWSNVQAKQLADRTKYLKDIANASGIPTHAYVDDIDEAILPGFFYVDADTSNIPSFVPPVSPNDDKLATLIVSGGKYVDSVDGSIDVATQICIPIYGTASEISEIYVRQYLENVGWTDWKQMASTDYADTVAEFEATTAKGEAVALSSPSGAVMAFARNSAPTGWLKANGAAVSRTTYAALFASIGTTFGAGNGTTTFNLPDLRGEFVRGWADDRSVDTGRVFGSAQSEEFKAHTHAITIADNGSASSGTTSVSSSSISNNSLESTSAGGTETRPRNVALLYCIKT